MIFFRLRKHKIYSKLKLYGGELIIGDGPFRLSCIYFDNFIISINCIHKYWLKEDELEIVVRNKLIERYCPFSGSFYERVLTLNCKESNVLISLQQALDYGYKRFIKLSVFN
jgi:hypothetical protein